MGKASRTIAAALIACTVVGFSGCDVASELLRPVPHGSPRVARESKPDLVRILLSVLGFETRIAGTNTPTGPGTTEVSDKTVSGPFTAKLPVNIAVPTQRARGQVVTNKVKGTFAAVLNGTTDANTGTATMSGTGVLSFKLKALGTACFTLNASFTQHATKGTGTFKSTGGTGGAATMRAKGTFTDTVTTIDSKTAKDSAKVHLRARLHKPPQAAPAACKSLVSQLP